MWTLRQRRRRRLHGAHPPLAGRASSLGVSGDGKAVYVVSAHSDSISRQPRHDDRRLTADGCIANVGANGCVAPPTTRWTAPSARRERKRHASRRFDSLELDQPLQPQPDDRRPHLQKALANAAPTAAWRRPHRWERHGIHGRADAIVYVPASSELELDQPLNRDGDHRRPRYKALRQWRRGRLVGAAAQLPGEAHASRRAPTAIGHVGFRRRSPASTRAQSPAASMACSLVATAAANDEGRSAACRRFRGHVDLRVAASSADHLHAGHNAIIAGVDQVPRYSHDCVEHLEHCCIAPHGVGPLKTPMS